MNLDDDDEITVHRPGRSDVTMRWGQWVGNYERYEAAGFTFTPPKPPETPKTNPDSPAKIIISTQGACTEDEPEQWDDMQLIEELGALYAEPEDFEHLPHSDDFSYREWAKGFIKSIQARFALTDKQRASALKLYRRGCE